MSSLTTKIEVDVLSEGMDDVFEFFYNEMMCDTIQAQKDQCLPEKSLHAWSNLLYFMNSVRDSFYSQVAPGRVAV